MPGMVVGKNPERKRGGSSPNAQSLLHCLRPDLSKRLNQGREAHHASYKRGISFDGTGYGIFR